MSAVECDNNVAEPSLNNWPSNFTGAFSYVEQGSRTGTSRSNSCSKCVKFAIILALVTIFGLITYTAFSLSATIGVLFTTLSSICCLVVLVVPYLCRCCTRLTTPGTCSQSECNTFEMQQSNHSRKSTEKYVMAGPADDLAGIGMDGVPTVGGNSDLGKPENLANKSSEIVKTENSDKSASKSSHHIVSEHVANAK